MVRRALTVALFVTPFVVFGGLHGCGTQQASENICNWLGDSNNCYAVFANDVATQCGREFTPDSEPLQDATGVFLDRTDLSICILSAGGQIVFDPPLDVSTFPVGSLAYKVLDRKANECGAGSYTSERSYSVTINFVDQFDAGVSVGADGEPLGDNITGGTFTSSVPDGGVNVFDITCPGGAETHHFSTNIVDSRCSERRPLLPRAVVDSSPGLAPTSSTSGENGYVRFRVEMPPADVNTDATPRVVEYFNCTIPAPPAPCEDGTKNGDETDVDCGGSCSTKCAEGLNCDDNDDCLSGSCGSNGGFQQCLPAS